MNKTEFVKHIAEQHQCTQHWDSKATQEQRGRKPRNRSDTKE